MPLKFKAWSVGSSSTDSSDEESLSRDIGAIGGPQAMKEPMPKVDVPGFSEFSIADKDGSLQQSSKAPDSTQEDNRPPTRLNSGLGSMSEESISREDGGPQSIKDSKARRDHAGAVSPTRSKAANLARQHASNPQLPQLEPHQHASFLYQTYLSLMEGRCKTQAASTINAGRLPENALSEDHPDVRELAGHLYTEMKWKLVETGILPAEFVGFAEPDEELRESYLSSFDQVLNGIAAERPQEPVGERVIQPILDLARRGATTTNLGDSHALTRAIPFAMGHPINNASTALELAGNKLVEASHTFGQYGNVAIIGKGGFGKVFKAKHPIDERYYAIKAIQMKEDSKLVKSTLDEVKCIAGLHHANVVKYNTSWYEIMPESLYDTSPKGPKAIQQAKDETDSETEDKYSGEESEYEANKFDKSPSIANSEMNVLFVDSKASQAKSPDPDFTPTDVSEVDLSLPISRTGNSKKMLYIQMALYEGSLKDFLSFKKPTPNATLNSRHCYHKIPAIRILKGVLEGLDYCHSQGVVHRDIKPANILLHVTQGSCRRVQPECYDINSCPDCVANSNSVVTPLFITPCLADFGLMANITNEKALKKDIGTVFYKPPSAPVICPKWDVYSLGVITFELLHKFESKSERISVLTDLGKGKFPPDFRYQEMIPGIRQMMCHDREKRWDCEEVRRWLEQMEVVNGDEDEGVNDFVQNGS